MTSTATEPISQHWTTDDANVSVGPEEPSNASPAIATAMEVNAHLARIEIADLDPHDVPYLAAAAAELALLVGIPWPFSSDDPPVALLRLIARVTMQHPHVGGPHTARLLDQLR